MTKWIKNNVMLFFVILYVILPDFLPGPIDDSMLLVAELVRKYVAKKLNSDKK